MGELDIERFLRLPVRANETWQGGFIRSPHCLPEFPDKPVRPVLAVWVSLRTGRASHSSGLAHPGEDHFAALIGALISTAVEDRTGYRPGKLEVSDPGTAARLAEMFSGSGTAVAHRERLSAVAGIAERMAEELAPDRVAPSLLDAKGSTIDRIRALADAACLFYERQVWKILTNEDLVEIESPRVGSEYRFTSIMGNAGQEFGFILFATREDFWTMAGAQQNPQNLSRLKKYWVVDFDHFSKIPIADLDLWVDHDLPVAGPRAYPTAACYRLRSGISKRPAPKVLTWMEGLLRALAASSEEEMDTGRWQKRVETFDGTAEYALNLTFLLNPPDRKTLLQNRVIESRVMESLLEDTARFAQESGFRDEEELAEAMAREFRGPIEGRKFAPRNAAEAARDLCYQAAEVIGRRRVHLARQALQLSPDCSEAYVILAEAAGDTQQAATLYASGVEAGERAFGEKFFKENEGHFWAIVETRGFMRALAGLGQCQAELGQMDDAIANYQRLLRLNPNDNQGIRYRLLSSYLECGRDAEAEGLLQQFDDDGTAVWCFDKALVTFRREGDSDASVDLLEAALEANHHVAALLLEDGPLPPEPSSYSLGSEEEAVIYVNLTREAWKKTSGALEWLADVAEIEWEHEDEADEDDDA